MRRFLTVEDSKKICIRNLLEIEESVLVFLFLSLKNTEYAKEELGYNKNLILISFREMNKILGEMGVVENYFGICTDNIYTESFPSKIKCTINAITNRNPRIAVYTCITGNYDKLNKLLVNEKNCDYFFITDAPDDEKIENEDGYKRISVDGLISNKDYSPKTLNRFCKSHGQSIFSNYDYSIYIDGNMQMICPIAHLYASRVGKYGVALHKHPNFDDIYVEAFSLSLRSRTRRDETTELLRRFAKEGFPKNYGATECNVIVHDHSSKIGKIILGEWFTNYVDNRVKRDQLYMPYTLWKMGIRVEDVCTLPSNAHVNGFFDFSTTHVGYVI